MKPTFHNPQECVVHQLLQTRHFDYICLARIFSNLLDEKRWVDGMDVMRISQNCIAGYPRTNH